MKNFSKVINIIAMTISGLTLVLLLVFIAVFSTTPSINTLESQITVDNVLITKRVVNQSTSYYTENVEENVPFFLILGFDLYEIEQAPIHLTIKNFSQSYIVNVSTEEIATVVYGFEG